MPSETMRIDGSWEEKYTMSAADSGIWSKLNHIESQIQQCNAMLRKVNLNVPYDSQKTACDNCDTAIKVLDAYVQGIREEIDTIIDDPFYKAFVNKATVTLQSIRVDKFRTANTPGLKETVMDQVNGYTEPIEIQGIDIGFQDFMGFYEANNIHLGKETVGDFAAIFEQGYEAYVKQNALDGGSFASLEQYLKALLLSANFDHSMDKPGLQMLSSVMGAVPFLKPLYELVAGKELLTGDNRSDDEQLMNLVSLGMDGVSIGTLVSALGKTGMGTIPALKMIAKSLTQNGIANTWGYVAKDAMRNMKMPGAIKLAVQLGLNVAMSHVVGDAIDTVYLLVDTKGNIKKVFSSAIAGDGEKRLKELVEDRPGAILTPEEEHAILLKNKPNTGEDIDAWIANGGQVRREGQFYIYTDPWGNIHIPIEDHFGCYYSFKSDDGFLTTIIKRRSTNIAPDGCVDFAMHGAPEVVAIETNEGTGIVNSNILADVIDRSGIHQPGQPIRLLSCSVGKKPDGLAQQLATQLNCAVYAPNDLLGANYMGEFIVFPDYSDPNGNWFLDEQGNVIPEVGRFELFLPDGRNSINDPTLDRSIADKWAGPLG